MEWKKVRLVDVCSELSDGLHKAPKFIVNGEYIFVNAKNLYNGYILDNDPTKKTSHEEYLKYKKPLGKHTILYSIDGTIGNIAKYRGEKCVLGKGACYINCNPEIVESSYLYYQLQSPHFKSYIHLMSTGSTIKHISLKTMRDYVFELPSLEAQRRIASILSSLDRKIELNNKINVDLEEMAQAIFKNWFVDFEPFK
uniref:restriction endonuclease subunit S n=1 Tax=Prevotella sp. TaxID=59823 RepID=UPI004029A433